MPGKTQGTENSRFWRVKKAFPAPPVERAHARPPVLNEINGLSEVETSPCTTLLRGREIMFIRAFMTLGGEKMGR